MLKKMKKIFRDGKALLMAFDHAVEHGPYVYEGINLDPKRIVEIAKHGADGIILHVGAAKYVGKIPKNLALIIKVTARTNLAPNMIEEIVTRVDEALACGADAIAATVYVGCEKEWYMLRNLAQLKLECMKRKLPLIAFMYPRVKGMKKNDVKAVWYAARLGAELGVDAVKTYYTGSKQSFAKVVEDCFVPVVVAGGKKVKTTKFLEQVKDVMEAGASGLAVGRNVWARDKKDAIKILEKLRKIVHD
jgi:class I fructose-bisphosphate aldolase